MFIRKYAGLTLTLWLMTLACGGCGNDEGISTDFDKPAAQRTDIQLKSGFKQPLLIPADNPFNYNSLRSGQSGTARGSATPQGSNGILATAQADNGGSAWAEFNLGYTFDMVGPGAPGVVRVRMKVSNQQQLRHNQPTTAPANDPTTLSSQLRFIIKDTGGALLKDENLLGGDGGKGARNIDQTYDMAFDVDFESGKGYYLVIAGRCSVEAAAGDFAEVQMNVSDASIEIKWNEDGAGKPAMTAKTATSP